MLYCNSCGKHVSDNIRELCCFCGNLKTINLESTNIWEQILTYFNNSLRKVDAMYNEFPSMKTEWRNMWVDLHASLILAILRFHSMQNEKTNFYNLFNTVSQNPNFQINHPPLNPTNDTRYDNLSKKEFFTSFLFCIEANLKKINNTYLENTEKFSIKSILIDFLIKLNYVGNPEIEDSPTFHILYLPFAVRNTFHQNGIYSHPTKEYTIRNILFTFKENTITTYTSWLHIALFIDTIIFQLIELCHHPKFKIDISID